MAHKALPSGPVLPLGLIRPTQGTVSANGAGLVCQLDLATDPYPHSSSGSCSSQSGTALCAAQTPRMAGIDTTYSSACQGCQPCCIWWPSWLYFSVCSNCFVTQWPLHPVQDPHCMRCFAGTMCKLHPGQAGVGAVCSTVPELLVRALCVLQSGREATVSAQLLLSADYTACSVHFSCSRIHAGPRLAGATTRSSMRGKWWGRMRVCGPNPSHRWTLHHSSGLWGCVSLTTLFYNEFCVYKHIQSQIKEVTGGSIFLNPFHILCEWTRGW